MAEILLLMCFTIMKTSSCLDETLDRETVSKQVSAEREESCGSDDPKTMRNK